MAEGLTVPEGPFVMVDGTVGFVQIRTGLLSRVDQGGVVSTIAELGGGPNGAAIGPDGAIYVCNTPLWTARPSEQGRATDRDSTPPCIQRVDPATGGYAVLYDDCDGSPLGGPNDLVFDTTGNFWFTDFKRGAIFYASPDGTSIKLVVDDLVTPNGIGLSPDGSVLYWAQTVPRQVMRRRLSSPGQLVESPGHSVRAALHRGGADPFVLVVGLPGSRELDSLAIEADGSVCVGTLLEGGIAVVAPEGGSVELMELPSELTDCLVTNICFGGEDMRTAYLTLAQHGRLISCYWPRPGLRLAF
jgi:gluconolactonase